MNTTDFIIKAKQRHGDKYGYDRVMYRDTLTKVKILCKECGVYFLQKPKYHLRGNRHKACNNREISKANILYSSLKEYISAAKKRHGNNYEYSGAFVDLNSKLSIACKRCKSAFWQSARSHLAAKVPCKRCSNEFKRTAEKTILARFRKIHRNRYDYSKMKYKSVTSKIEVICRRCNVSWFVTPSNHIYRQSGCPNCKLKSK